VDLVGAPTSGRLALWETKKDEHKLTLSDSKQDDQSSR
jgi:hypothetical protein